MVTQHTLSLTSIQLRKAVVLAFADASAGAIFPRNGDSGHAAALIDRFRAGSLEDWAIHNDVSKSIRMLRLPETSAYIVPVSKVAKLRESPVRRVKIHRFFKTASHMCAFTGVRFCFSERLLRDQMLF